MQYFINENNLYNTHANATGTNSLPSTCNLDTEKLRQLQQQDKYITILIAKCKSTKSNKTPYYLDKQGITYRKIRDRPNNFYAIIMLYNHIFYMKAEIH